MEKDGGELNIVSRQDQELAQIEALIRKETHTYSSIKQYFQRNLNEKNLLNYIEFLEGIFEKKTVIFIRHAESGYNEWRKKSIFNLPFTYKNIPENHDPSITNRGEEKL